MNLHQKNNTSNGAWNTTVDVTLREDAMRLASVLLRHGQARGTKDWAGKMMVIASGRGAGRSGRSAGVDVDNYTI